MTGKTMPIQVDGELALTERRGERIVLVKSIPWEMISDEHCEKQSQRNHSQTVDRIRQRGGYGAAEAIRVMAGLTWDDPKLSIPSRDAHRILYAMVVLFNRGQRLAEARPVTDAEVDVVCTALRNGESHATSGPVSVEITTGKVREALETAAAHRAKVAVSPTSPGDNP